MKVTENLPVLAPFGVSSTDGGNALESMVNELVLIQKKRQLLIFVYLNNILINVSNLSLIGWFYATIAAKNIAFAAIMPFSQHHRQLTLQGHGGKAGRHGGWRGLDVAGGAARGGQVVGRTVGPVVDHLGLHLPRIFMLKYKNNH